MRTVSARLGLTALGAAAGTMLTGPAAFATTHADDPVGVIQRADSPDRIAGKYIVVLKDNAAVRQRGVPASADELANEHDGSVEHVFTKTLKGFSVSLDEADAKRLAGESDVAYVEADQKISLNDTQTGATWGLDRIDQQALPLSGTYTYSSTASNVHAYIIDTGILTTHTQFGDRATSGHDFIDDDSDATDCNGHGTHVAGTVGGSTYGVSKGVQLVGVRVLDCSGSGTDSGVIAGVEWVTANAVKPAVANMSLGGGVSTALDTAVANSIASGVTYAVAAGNENTNASGSSPARVGTAITVGATTSSDARASYSNYGSILDIFAPGSGITSAWYSSTTATNTISGTSMATPHVAGAAALVLADHPSYTPAEVTSALTSSATSGVVTGPGSGSPNLLLYTGGTTPAPPPGAVYSDTFETSTDWTVNASSTDTAALGAWERANPAGTSSSGVTTQLGTTAGGSHDLVTGPLAGSSAGSYDVDGGATSIQSPTITLPSSGTLTLTFDWYLAHLNNATSADYLRVRVVGSTTTTVLTQTGSATNRGASWATATANISGHAGQTVRIVIDAADAGTPSLVEAAADNVTITRS